MWIAIVAVAVAVLGAAVYAGRGTLGEMPASAVNDRPKGVVPDGPVTPELLAELRIPGALTGYRRDQVDAYLDDVAVGIAGPAAAQHFDVVRGGYDMQVVDVLIERPRVDELATVSAAEAPTGEETRPQEPVDGDSLDTQPGRDLPDAE